MALEKKYLGALLALALSGCRYYADPKSKPTFLNPPAHTYDGVLITNYPPPAPMPGISPELDHPEPIIRRESLRAKSAAPVTVDKYVVVRWDPVSDTNVSFRVNLRAKNKTFVNSYNTTQTKVNLVPIMRDLALPQGWYVVTVQAVNELFVESDSVTACQLFWHPTQ